MNSKHIKIISVSCAAAVLGIFFFVYHTYNEAVGATKEKFSLQQDMLAKEIALGIEENTDILINELKFLSSQQPLRDMDINKSKIILENIYEHVRHYSVDDVALLDSKGTIRFALNAPFLTGQDFSYRQYYQTARTLRTSSPIYEFVEFKAVSLGQKGMIIAIPLFSTENHFNGVVLFTVRINNLIGRMIPSETYKNSVWILDAEGKIIYHPGYSPGTDSAELAGKSKSLKAFLEELHDEEHYHAEYVSPQDGDMIASFLSIPVAGKTWIVAISMPVRPFSGIISHSTTEYAIGLLLISLIATGIIFMSVSYNRQLKKSHDELELRVSERTQDLMTINEELEEEISNHVIAKASLRASKLTAEDEKAKSEAILACMGDAISIQSTDFQVLYQNSIHRDVMGNRVGEYCYEVYEQRDEVCEGCPMAKAFEDGAIHSAERSTTLTKGHIIHVDITASPLRNSDGEIIGGIEIVRDITKRKLAAEAHRQAEEELRTIYNAISGHLNVIDTNYRILSYNKAVEKQFGNDLKGKLCYESFQARNEVCPDCAVRKTLKTKEPAFTFQPASPLSNPTEIYTYPIFDDRGEVVAVVEHGIEVTEKVKMEKALRKSEERYRHLLELAQEGIWVIDKNDITTFVNSSMAFMLGYAVDEMLDRHLFSFLDEKAVEIAKQRLEVRKRGIGEQHDFEFIRKDGSRIHTTVVTSPILDEDGNYNGSIAGVIDITERKKAEDKLREAHSLLETLIEAMPYAVFFKDADGRHVIVNEACCKSSGHTKEDFLGKTCDELLPPDLAEACHRSDEEIMRGRKTIRIDEQRTDDDGNTIFLDTIKTPIFDENGNIKGMIGMFHDITWRKRIEEELIRSRNLLSMINKARELYILKSSKEEVFGKLLDALVLFTESEYGFINEVLTDQNGDRYMLTLALADISWDDDSRLLYEQLRKRGFEFRNLNTLQATPAATGKLVISNNRAQDPRSVDLPKGHPPIDNFMGIPMYFGGVLVGVAGVANRDGGYNEQIASFLEPFISSCASIISAFRNEEIKKFLHEESLRAAQLASVGELAAGVAHEINNPINGIINYAQILFNRSTQDGNKDIANRILREGDRISCIVKSLLSFARPDDDYRTSVSVGELLHEVLSLIGTQLRKEGIILETRIPEKLPEIKVNRQQMEQVFLNIINNSHYALNQKYQGMDPDKVLTISSSKYKHGGIPYVRITFTDKGTGIPSHLIDKVTTTFFTTKPKGKGTGLGLSISQNIVNDHGGKLTIESNEGDFTTVNIDIPIADTSREDELRLKKHKKSTD